MKIIKELLKTHKCCAVDPKSEIGAFLLFLRENFRKTAFLLFVVLLLELDAA